MCAYMCAVVTEDRDRQQATGKERDKENLKQNFKKFVILLKITRHLRKTKTENLSLPDLTCKKY